MKNEKIKRLVLSAMFAALTTVATLIIQIPSFNKGGYINLGDVVVNVEAWVLGPLYGAAAAGIGSALADVLSAAGGVVYAPVTLIIKALMAVVSFYIAKGISKKFKPIIGRIIGAVVAEILMASGYASFDAVVLLINGGAAGAITAAVIADYTESIIQGTAGVVGSILVYDVILERIPAIKHKKI